MCSAGITGIMSSGVGHMGQGEPKETSTAASNTPGGNPPDRDDDRAFPLTQWSLVARAGADPTPDDPTAHAQRREALGVILTRYSPALRVHLRARGIDADNAENLLHSFITDRVIERN